MRTIILDFTPCMNRDEIHHYLKKQFDFPDYYGENLDALYDMLTSIMEDIEVVFAGDDADTCCEAVCGDDVPVKSEKTIKYLKKVRRVFHDAAKENGHLHL